MDPLTHAITGAAIGYALGGHKLQRHAAAVGALAGIAPDIDHFVSSEADPLLYVEFHRYFTHSILFAVAGSFITTLPWLLVKRFRAAWRLLWLCAWGAYVSHGLLDASTTWGTQLYWPFSRARVSWDIISIVDPVFTLVFGVGLAIALVQQSRRAALSAIGFAAAYLSFGAVQHARALSAQAEFARSRGHVIERSEAMPTLGNNLVWRSLYLAQGKLYSDRIRVGWLSPAAVREGSAAPLMTSNQLTAAESAGNLQHRGFDRFAWFSDGWLARSPADASVIGDMRYSRSTEAFDPVWGIRFTNAHGRASVEWISRERDRRLGVRELWAEITGNDARFRRLAEHEIGVSSAAMRSGH